MMPLARSTCAALSLSRASAAAVAARRSSARLFACFSAVCAAQDASHPPLVRSLSMCGSHSLKLYRAVRSHPRLACTAAEEGYDQSYCSDKHLEAPIVLGLLVDGGRLPRGFLLMSGGSRPSLSERAGLLAALLRRLLRTPPEPPFSQVNVCAKPHLHATTTTSLAGT